MIPRMRALAGLVALALAGSCVAHDTPTGVGEALLPAGIALQPALIPSPADGGAQPINRIRAVVTQVPGGAVLEDTTAAVQPTDPAWTLDIRVPLVASPTRAVAYFYLLNQGGAGTPTVEFSGVTDTLTLSAGQVAQGGDIPIVRGPLANLYVTDVSITSTSPVLAQGQTLGLTAAVTTSGPGTPTVFWTSLDPTIASFDSATVTGISPGVTDVVASAGAHADTTSLTVFVPPVDSVEVSPSSANVTVAQSVQYTATLRDAGNNILTGRQIAWTTGSASIATVDANGLVTGVAQGTTTVTATSEGVSDDATIVVQPLAGGPGAINEWIAGASGTWSTPASWSQGRVPVPADTVRLTTGVDFQVTLDTDVTVASVQIGGTSDVITLDVGDFNLVLTDAGPGTALDILPLGSVVVGNGTVTAPTIDNNGSFHTVGPALLTATQVQSAGTWRVAGGGTLIMTSGTTLDFQTSGTVTVDGALVIDVGGNLTYQGGTFDGTGVLVATTGAQLILNVDLSIDGPGIYLDEAAIPGTASRFTIGPSSLLYLSSTSGNPAEVNAVTTNQGSLYASGPSSYLNDSLYVDAGAVVYVDASAEPTQLGTWGVDNSGYIALVGSFDATFGPGSPTGQFITNRPTGEIDLASSGQNNLNGQLINEGLVNVAGPSQLYRTSAQGQAVAAQHLNSGQIDLLTGTLDVILGGTSPTITNTGTITVGTGATLRVTNNSNPPGQVINGPTGVLEGTGTVDLTPGSPVGLNLGSIAPGFSPGALSWSGNVPMGSGGTIDIELSGTTPGTGYDQLNIGGVLLLDYQGPANGTLNVTTPGFTPQDGDRFAVLTFAARSGNFATVSFPTVPGITFDTLWTTGQSPDTLYITATGSGGPPILNAWTGGGDGTTWGDGSNWSGGVPQPGDSVVIDLAGTYTVMLDQDAQVQSVSVAGSSGTQALALNGFDLRATDDVTVGTNGVVTVELSDTLAAGGAVTNQGGITLEGAWIDAALSNQGTLVVHASSVITGAITTTPTSIISIEGQAGIEGVLSTASGFTNNGVLELTDIAAGAGYGTLTIISGTLVNQFGATIRALPGVSSNSRFIFGQLENYGDVAVSTNFAVSGTTHVNAGIIDITAGQLSLTMTSGGSFTNQAAGSITTSGSGILSIGASGSPAPTFTNLGALTIGTNTFAALSGNGTFDLASGTLTNGGTLSIFGTANVFAPASYNNTANLLITGSSTWNGTTLTNAASGYLETGNFATIAADLVNQGAVQLISFSTTEVSGSVDASASPITAQGPQAYLSMTGNGTTLQGTVPAVYILGSTSLAGATTASDSLIVQGAAGILDVNGQTLDVAGTLRLIAGSRFSMTNVNDDVTVGGSAEFSGGSTSGLLTAGTLRVAGGVSAVTSDGFVASGTHTTVLTGTGSQGISFSDPQTSRFTNLDLAQKPSGSVTLATEVAVDGTFVMAGNVTVFGQVNYLRVAGMNVDGGILDNVRVDFQTTLANPTLIFDNVTFQNYAVGATWLSIAHPGGNNYSFSGLTFGLPVPTTGFYVSATDNAADGQSFTLTISNDPGNAAARTEIISAGPSDTPTVIWN